MNYEIIIIIIIIIIINIIIILWRVRVAPLIIWVLDHLHLFIG
jgi:hypothetical protein